MRLPIIVFSQFAGTSLWFAGNVIIGAIQPGVAGLASVTSFVQFGFIAGTLVFSLLALADKFPAPRVFFFSSFIAALLNFLLIWLAKDLTWLYILRFSTGFFLAGIYPVGMKIAADCFPGKLGNALGYLVGALVVGTAFPYFFRSYLPVINWKYVVITTSLLSVAGGLLILLFVPGKKSTASSQLKASMAFSVFRIPRFRAVSFGYFGHMWELYAFWAFLPVLIGLYNSIKHTRIDVSLWSFLSITAGALGCIAGGILAQKAGSKKIAFYALAISGACCLFSPLLFRLPPFAFLSVLVIWGITVVADSPQFSTLVAQSAPPDNKGTALTIVTSAGFAITIVSIQLLRPAVEQLREYGWLMLCIGPATGLFFLKNYLPAKAGR
jgi:MFS family permease